MDIPEYQRLYVATLKDLKDVKAAARMVLEQYAPKERLAELDAEPPTKFLITCQRRDMAAALSTAPSELDASLIPYYLVYYGRSRMKAASLAARAAALADTAARAEKVAAEKAAKDAKKAKAAAARLAKQPK